MRSKEDRSGKITSTIHFTGAILRRRNLFATKRPEEIFKEIKYAIRDPTVCVFVPEERTGNYSGNYCAVFPTSANRVAGIVTFVDDETKDITLITIKDVYKDKNNPTFLIRKYNEVARADSENMELLSFRAD